MSVNRDHYTDELSDVLAQIDSWSADVRGVEVFNASGPVASYGETQSPVPVASITKLATAWAVLIGVEEGALGLNDPAGPPGSTIGHLLCHASGLPFEGDTPIATPGVRRIYSNSGYELLAKHLESSTAIPFENYLQEAVLDPLEMTSTTLEGSPAAGLRSTTSDVARLGGELLSPTLIDQSTWSQATTVNMAGLSGVLPGWGQQNPCPWGLGPEIRGPKSPHWTGLNAPPRTFGHFGALGSFLWIDAGVGFGCAAVTDRAFGDWAIEVWPGFSDAVRSVYLGLAEG